LTSVLQRVDLTYYPRDLRAAIEAVGGRWKVAAGATADQIVAAARAGGVRALTVPGSVRDLAFLAELPDLEFLGLGDARDVAPVHRLPRLRSLAIVSFRTRLDLAALPSLEWFGVDESPSHGIDSVRDGHPALAWLAVGRYPLPDLSALGPMRLRVLSLGGTGLERLAGIEAFAPTVRRLVLDRCPNLASLAGIETLSGLQYLELGNLPHVTTLDRVASLPELRFLNVFELNGVATLAPLAGHPTLEYLNVGRTRDLDLEPLERIPNLKLFNTGRYRWNRDLRQLPYFQLAPADGEARRQWTAWSLG
jgi:hypothetical protein